MSNPPLSEEELAQELCRQEREALHRGTCPWSGLGLYPWPNDGVWPGRLGCWPCDCGGYTAEEVRAEN